MPRRKADAQKQTVSLHIAPSFASAVEDITLPWFETAALSALERARPAAVLTPFPTHAAFLRSRLLQRGTPLLGIKFLTPPVLREFLLADAAVNVPLREHLRLLLAIAAESIAARYSSDVDLRQIAKSVARSPDNLLRVLDEIGAAGWSFEETEGAALVEIVREFRQLVSRCDFKLIHQIDREILQNAAGRPKRFSAVLVSGFTAAHWAMWPLLQSAVLSAERSTVILEYPRDSTRTLDETWIGTWEEAFGSAQELAAADEAEKQYGDLIGSDRPSANGARPYFVAGLNTTEQAQAVCAMTLQFLAEKSCNRVGILFAGPGALPRLVSELLTRCGIFHYDGIGHRKPGEFEEAAWNSWLQLQENHQLEPLLRFLETHPKALGGLSIHRLRSRLRTIYREILIDNLAIFRQRCARQTDSQELAQIGEVLDSITFLPANATLGVFLTQTEEIFTALGWQNRWSALEQFTADWANAVPIAFSRVIYLRWLKETLDSFSVSRAAEANHVYSRVHLLSYGDAQGQEWSHLIVAGLNQGEWPPAEHESGFLTDDQIAALNNRATRPGKQGVGHVTTAEGKTLFLGSQNQRHIALSQFAAAIESVEHGLALSASLLQQSAPERIWNPSELLSHIYFASFGEPLSQEMLSNLREKTSTWLHNQSLLEQTREMDGDAEQTRVAYSARRRAEVPFGQYEFALRSPLDRRITLRATEWDRVVKTPALIWMKIYLGLENQDPDLNQWNAATGTWVHDWLAQIAPGEKAFVRFPTGGEALERVRHAATEFKRSVVDLCAAIGRPLPDWWSSGWSNAFALADFLASRLVEIQAWPQLSTEWELESQELTLDAGKKLRVRGRIDLILSENRSADSQLAGRRLWIIDYKTGNVKPLSVSARTPEARAAKLRQKLIRGDAIQLGFYGLAARELGARDVQLSILSLRTDLDKPQLVLDDLAQHREFWNELYRMQETGVFGLRGLIRNEFGFHPDYPLAILPIDKEFLDEKWVLTHPAFADEEEDWS